MKFFLKIIALVQFLNQLTSKEDYLVKIESNYRRGTEFIRRPCPYRTVPYRFPRGTVYVDRTAYRTFLTVFREFCLKARPLPRFKFYRSAV
jgi:hypothetical protein